MKTEFKDLPQSQIEISVDISWEEMTPFLQKSAIRISERSKIEGFRPGKAPYDIVKQKFGEMAILEEAIDDAISKTYYTALKEKNIMAIGQPKIDLEKIAPENPFTYKAIVSVLPSIKIGDWQKIELHRETITIEAEKTEKIIADIRKMRAKETIKETPAKENDKLEINFDVFLDKVPIENGSQKKYPITIGENRFIPGFEEQLVGLKAGEVKDFSLKFPDEYHQKNLAGKKADFRVTCNAVYSIVLPETNDEFAKEISGGHFATFAEMKDNIKKNLEEEEKHKQEQRLEIEMLESIIKICEFGELPEVLVHNEIHRMLHELEESVSRQGFEFDDYLKSLKKTHDDLEKEFEPQAKERVKTSILCREIYQEQKMDVTEDEVQKEISEILKNYPANPEVQKQLEAETYKDYLKNTLGNRKVIEYLKATVIKD